MNEQDERTETEAERAEEAAYWAREDARHAAAEWAVRDAEGEGEEERPEDDPTEW